MSTTTILEVDPAGIPLELINRDQWVAWRIETPPGRKPTKIPYNPRTQSQAQSDNPATWGTFSRSLRMHHEGFDGVGYVFADTDDYFGIDLDACRNPDTGELTDWAQEIVDAFPTYCEISPSGYGVKLTGRGRLPDWLLEVDKTGKPKTGRSKRPKKVATFGDKAPEIAIYDRRRFWTYTGHRLPSAPESIGDCQAELDALVARLWPTEKAKADNRHESNGAPEAKADRKPTDGDTEAALKAMLGIDYKDSGDGSKRLFMCCCRAVEHGLNDEQAIRTIRSYEGVKPFPVQWSDADILTRLRDAEKRTEKKPASAGEWFSNAVVTKADKDTITEPIPLPQLIESMREHTGNWPRSIGGTLFLDDANYGIAFLPKPSDLFGWLRAKFESVVWHISAGCAKTGEFFSEVRRTATTYRAVEALPHFPSLVGHYYTQSCRDIKPGDGETLRELLARFNPATTIDGDLILALFVTPFWGGAGGSRPAFAITSDDGRGVGKTTLGGLAGRLVGGSFEIALGDQIDGIKRRLLTPEALTKRSASIDNIKSNRLSWGDLEGLITAHEISGHQMFSGERVRPNTLTWILTLNGPSFSRDMAQRSVIIKIARPIYSGDWGDDTKAFIDNKREKLIADIAAFFQKPAATIEKSSRWGPWERDVLARLAEPSEAQKVILERQAEIDGDADEVAVIEDHFREMLLKYNYDPDADSVHIPNAIAAEWYGKAINDRVTTTAMTRAVRQYASDASFRYLQIDKCHTHGRGLLWYAGGQAHTDVEERIEHRRREERRGY